MEIRKSLLFFLTGMFLAFHGWGQVVIPNSGFEEADPAAAMQTAHWRPESDNFQCKADNHAPYQGKYSLHLVSSTPGNHFFNQEFPFTSPGLRKFKVRCALKTKNLEGKLQLGIRLFDVEGGLLPKTMLTLTTKKDQGWTMAEGMFVADKDAAKARLFGNLYGTGEAWYDAISIEEMPEPTKAPSSEVALYVHEYFDVVYENSVITDKNFIADLKSRTMSLCGGGTSLSECHSILTYYTTPGLGDDHSFFTTAAVWKEMMEGGKHPNTGAKHQEMPSGKMLSDHIGYLHVPMFISSDNALMRQYADTLQSLIASMDRQNPKGYILDLSDNGGGNSFPMVAGVGPLLGNGVCGHSLAGDGSVHQRIYRDGWVGWDSSLTFQKLNPYTLEHPGKPIAIVQGSMTGSSGEVVVIAFIGLPNARSFGQPTYGVTTTVTNFELRDGAYLNLVNGYSADRNRKQYNGPIIPDVETQDRDSAIDEAARWIIESLK